ncbi:MAG: hypothetical protein CVU08_12775 [Bacteroidetes bacterium HGW-Bacteroidetes-3]|nr:MAG: hypothetical protein CVU08_12775 [Bacteroidetes bacterium HGW-Bacteroidetes-3]
MFKTLKNILKVSNRFYLLGISITNDISEYQLIELLFKNNELKIEKRFFSSSFDSSLKKELLKGYPIILHVEGENVMNKIVENKTGYRNNVIFKANPDDFYFFEYHQDTEIFLSIARKYIIDGIINKISDINLYVIHISIGPFVMANLLPILNGYSKISSSNCTLDIDTNSILSFKNEISSLEKFVVKGEVLDHREMPLIASFLDYKYPNLAIDFDNKFLTQNKSEYLFKKRFKVSIVFSLLFFLVSLTISHNLHNFYLSSLAKNKSFYLTSQKTIIEINTLRDEKILKEKILQTSGVYNKSFIVKYIADIGNFVPGDITLKSIDVVPTLKKIRNDEKINFNFGSIEITGETSNDNSFNSWITDLKTLPWIEKMDIVDYTEEQKAVKSFIIKIRF